MLWDTSSLCALHVTTYTLALFTSVKITNTQLRALNCVLRDTPKGFSVEYQLYFTTQHVAFGQVVKFPILRHESGHSETSQPETPAVDICLVGTLVLHSISLHALNRMP